MTHTLQIHGLNARDYKKKFGYDLKRGLIAEDYRAIKRDTQDPKTLENLKKGKRFWFKKGDHSVGRYERSAQTKARLVNQGRYVLPHPSRPKNY